MEFQTAPIRVLIVDDESGLLDLAALHLERADDRLSIVTESTARDGLARLADESIDCIVSDYQMPGMDGLAFFEEVRATAGDLPFILFTGKGSEEIATQAINAGVDGYVPKEVGTAQYTVLAQHILTLAEKHCAQRRLDSLAEELHLADGGETVTVDDHDHEESTTKAATDSVSMAVVEAVAAREGVDPLALTPPLAEVINPDALDNFFASQSTASAPPADSVTFTYRGYTVTVDRNGEIELEEHVLVD